MPNEDHDSEIDGWLRTLPFPLAAVLWRFVGEADSRARLDNAMYFFEAAARYLAILLLSGLAHDRGLFEAGRRGWQGLGRSPSSLLRRTTLGTWVHFHADLAKAVRRAVENDSARVMTAFAVESEETIKAITSKAVVACLGESVLHRNEWRGHDAGSSGAERKRRVESMAGLMLDLRNALDGELDGWELIKPRSMRLEGDSVLIDAFVFDGPNARIRTSSIRLTESVRTDTLYGYVKGSTHALPLLPLMSVVQSDDVAESSVYFYDRIDGTGTRWLSYDAEDRPEQTTPTPDWLLSLLRDLDEPSSGPTGEGQMEPEPTVQTAPPSQSRAVTESARRAQIKPTFRTLEVTLADTIHAVDASITRSTDDFGTSFYGSQRFAWITVAGGRISLVVHVPIERAPHVPRLVLREVPVTADDRPGLAAELVDRDSIPSATAIAAAAFALDRGASLTGENGDVPEDGAGDNLSFGNGLWPPCEANPIVLRPVWEAISKELMSRTDWTLASIPAASFLYRAATRQTLDLTIRVDRDWYYAAVELRDLPGQRVIERIARIYPVTALGQSNTTYAQRTMTSLLVLRRLGQADALAADQAAAMSGALIDLVAEVESLLAPA